MHKIILAALASIALASCNIALPGSGPAPDMYELSPKNTFPEGLPNVKWQLVVEEPIAGEGLNTDRIAVKPTPYELKYFPSSKWSGRAPVLVQTLLIESFENSQKIVSVGRRAVGLTGDYVLKTELREFQVERYGENGEVGVKVRVRLTLKLVRVASGVIVASESFERVETAASDKAVDIIPAFDEALGGVLKRAVAWTLTAGQKDWKANRY